MRICMSLCGALTLWALIVAGCSDDNGTNVILPRVPSNPSPANGATIERTNIILRWQCSHPEGKALLYDVYFDTMSPPRIYRYDRYDRDTLIVFANFEKTYYWKIVAVDENYNSASSPIWSFTTSAYIDAPPDPPSTPEPADGEAGVPPDHHLFWNCSDPFADPVTFDVYLGSDSNPPLVSSGRPYNVYSHLPLTPLTPYFWKIVAQDSAGNRVEGPLWSFTTGPADSIDDLPDLPQFPDPDSGEIDVSPYDFRLSWHYQDPYNVPVTFGLYFGLANPPPFLLNTIARSYAFVDDTLDHATTYYWRVKVTDMDGDTAVGPIWSFTTWPENLTYIGGYEIDATGTDICVAGNYAYVGTDGSGLHIVDVSDPANPVRIGRAAISPRIDGVIVAGAYSYLSTYNRMLILDISDPANPALIGGFDSPNMRAVAVDGNYAYIADFNDGLKIVNISDRANPGQVGALGINRADDIEMAGAYAFVTGQNGLEIVRIDNPANPMLAGEYGGMDAEYGLALAGNYAYIAGYNMRILDISVPSRPRVVRDVAIASSPNDIEASGDRIYVATSYMGVHVFDMTDPSDAHLTGVQIEPRHVRGIDGSGDYVYAVYENNENPEMRVYRLGP